MEIQATDPLALYVGLRTFSDVQRLVAEQRPEGLHLDYKSLQNVKESTFKVDVAALLSAFANTEGGVAIYGVKTERLRESEKDNRDFPVSIEPANGAFPDASSKIRQWAEDLVMPSLQAVRINPIDGPSGQFAIVVYVPQSAIRPHQAREKLCYYRRNADNSRPMEHAQVELLFRTRVAQELNQMPFVKVSENKPVAIDHRKVSIHIDNVGNVPAWGLEVSLDGVMVGRRTALGPHPDTWKLEVVPHEDLRLPRFLSEPPPQQPPPIVIRFRDVATATYEATFTTFAEVHGPASWNLRPNGEMSWRRVE